MYKTPMTKTPIFPADESHDQDPHLPSRMLVDEVWDTPHSIAAYVVYRIVSNEDETYEDNIIRFVPGQGLVKSNHPDFKQAYKALVDYLGYEPS